MSIKRDRYEEEVIPCNQAKRPRIIDLTGDDSENEENENEPVSFIDLVEDEDEDEDEGEDEVKDWTHIHPIFDCAGDPNLHPSVVSLIDAGRAFFSRIGDDIRNPSWEQIEEASSSLPRIIHDEITFSESEYEACPIGANLALELAMRFVRKNEEKMTLGLQKQLFDLVGFVDNSDDYPETWMYSTLKNTPLADDSKHIMEQTLYHLTAFQVYCDNGLEELSISCIDVPEEYTCYD